MSKLVIQNGHVITPVHERFTNIWVEDGRINSVADNPPEGWAARDYETIDASGCFVTPGLIDLQVNGDKYCDFWADPTESDLSKLRGAFAEAGVTSFLPTLITDDVDHLRKNVDWLTAAGAGVKQKWLQERGSARMVGIHLEGPCLSPERPGVHPPQHIKEPTVDLFSKIVNDSVKLITLACERDAKGDGIKWLNERGVVVSLGHSNATFEEAETAFERGVRMMTHTFNALPPLHHRKPGAVGAALLDRRVSCCLIADGLHLSAPAVELILRMKGVAKTILVTDIAHIGTTGGDLVGSSLMLNEAVKNVVNWGAATFREAILMASWNPAEALGLTKEIGSLQNGALADIVMWSQSDLAIKQVLIGGKSVSSVASKKR